MKRLGFIGLGAMGAPIARNLAAAGFELAVLDVDERRTRESAHARGGLGREDDAGVIRMLEDR